MRDVEIFLEQVTAWAREEANVPAVLVVGSHARTATRADEWSDVGFDSVREEDPSFALAPDGRRLDERQHGLAEPPDPGGFVDEARRVVREDDDVATIARGYRVLHDELALAELLDGATATPAPRRDPRELAEDFWYHALWAAEKLRRGEELTARFCVERVLKGLLLDLAREHALRRDPTADTWHTTRFAERWADPRAIDAIWNATAAEPAQLATAIRALTDAFQQLAAELVADPPSAEPQLARLLP